MATNGGGKIIRDGLVFGYDSGYGVANNSTPTKFYKGEPTTNLKSSTQTTGAINGMSGVGVTYVGEEDGWKKYSLSGTFSNGTYPYCMYLSSQQCLAGMRYSTQAIIKTNVRDKFNYFGSNGVSYVNQPKNHEGVNSSTLLSDGSQLLQRQGFEYTSTTTQAGYLWTNPINNTTFNPSTDFVYLKDFQIEQKIHCTPFVSDEREETESLIDLTKSANIDVSNSSFDSTGQPTFDGTNDYINIINYTQHQRSAGTIEAVVKLNTISGNRYVFGAGGTYTYGATRALRVNSGYWGIVTYGSGTEDWGTGVAASTTDWQHVAFGWDGTTVYFYINGVRSNTTRSGLVTPLGTTLRIGMPPWSIGSASDGQIALIKHYSTVLTESEIKQNYNAYKNRFDI